VHDSSPEQKKHAKSDVTRTDVCAIASFEEGSRRVAGFMRGLETPEGLEAEVALRFRSSQPGMLHE
jgi:hypothetical protein